MSGKSRDYEALRQEEQRAQEREEQAKQEEAEAEQDGPSRPTYRIRESGDYGPGTGQSSMLQSDRQQHAEVTKEEAEKQEQQLEQERQQEIEQEEEVGHEEPEP